MKQEMSTNINQKDIMMKKEAMTQRWEDSRQQQYYYSISPAMAPGNSTQENGFPFLQDKHYELHGEILMLVLVSILALCIVFFFMLPYLRPVSHHESEHSGPVPSDDVP
ncbi:hypothetical protein I3760_14G058400 [Carya illinoinensis]|nr:hypothetical protein I3760_14G058400 [Carya illinoinensis]